jgi:hypothetical protein
MGDVIERASERVQLVILTPSSHVAASTNHLDALLTRTTWLPPRSYAVRQSSVRHPSRAIRFHAFETRRATRSESNKQLTSLSRSCCVNAQAYRVEQPSPPPPGSVRWDHSPPSRWRTANLSTDADAADVKTRMMMMKMKTSERPLRRRARFGPEPTVRDAANAPQLAWR